MSKRLKCVAAQALSVGGTLSSAAAGEGARGGDGGDGLARRRLRAILDGELEAVAHALAQRLLLAAVSQQRAHDVAVDATPAEGQLFALPAVTLSERISARKDSIEERVAHAISVTPSAGPFVWWCNLNAEADALSRGLGAVNLHGSLDDDRKERILVDFSEGRIERLVTKPTIAGFGMNWQHCADTGFVGLNDSWEQFYQAVRRFWRFGQSRAVNCHMIAAETEGATVANIRRKEADADRMAAAMVRHMADLSSANVRGASRTVATYAPSQRIILPSFLKDAA